MNSSEAAPNNIFSFQLTYLTFRSMMDLQADKATFILFCFLSVAQLVGLLTLLTKEPGRPLPLE